MEKISLLKETDIFKNVREGDLTDIASVLEEQSLKAGDVIFNKGDVGNCMYLIHEGSVRIHDGSYTLALLGKNEVFGELSLLDAETRSATATCEEDSILFKLGQDPFYNILSKDQEVLKGILKMLCRRIRILDAKSAQNQ
ncbi:MAG TPA: cyclic nucleotide-binding domain-containing protein [Hanamia sp.]|nr:cyclic nucleotide-binding domain-containing protein [Hanamia sp.]